MLSPLLLSSLLFSFSLATDPKYCPTLDPYGPCVCRHGNFYIDPGTSVTCSRLTDPASLYKAVQQFRGYHVDFLELSDLNLPYLSPGLFSGTWVKRMSINRCTLEKLYNSSFPSPFDDLEDSLQSLSFMLTKEPSNWYWPDMSKLRNVKHLEFGWSPLNFVGHVFAEIGKGSLQSIRVVYSNVSRIHPQGFTELTLLTNADFEGNSIPYMVRTMFPDPAPALKTIFLRNNLLFNLPENMFENMPALNFLDLSRNAFKELQEAVLSPILSQLESFYISGNPVECNCELKWLKLKMDSGNVPKYSDLEFLECFNTTSKKSYNVLSTDVKLICDK